MRPRQRVHHSTMGRVQLVTSISNVHGQQVMKPLAGSAHQPTLAEPPSDIAKVPLLQVLMPDMIHQHTPELTGLPVSASCTPGISWGNAANAAAAYIFKAASSTFNTACNHRKPATQGTSGNCCLVWVGLNIQLSSMC